MSDTAPKRRWFPDPLTPDASGLAFVGGELSREALVEAYGRGLFPWRGGADVPWYCPDPRGVLRVGALRVSRSLAMRARNGGVSVAFDVDFRGVMQRCANTARRHESSTWITEDIVAAYSALHDVGIAHAVEVYREGVPIGGLYGLTFGGIFHGESMYHRAPDGSKLALWALHEALRVRGFWVIDCQVPSPHLIRLGAERWPAREYLALLARNAHRPSAHHDWSTWRVACLPAWTASGRS